MIFYLLMKPSWSGAQTAAGGYVQNLQGGDLVFQHLLGLVEV